LRTTSNRSQWQTIFLFFNSNNCMSLALMLSSQWISKAVLP
jgi:hypothetical protein